MPLIVFIEEDKLVDHHGDNISRMRIKNVRKYKKIPKILRTEFAVDIFLCFEPGVRPVEKIFERHQRTIVEVQIQEVERLVDIYIIDAYPYLLLVD